MNGLDFKADGNGVRLRVRVKPRASKSRVLGVRDGALVVAVAAPPVDGEANAELVKVLARHFEIPQRSVTIVAGASGKSKLVGLTGVSESALREKVQE